MLWVKVVAELALVIARIELTLSLIAVALPL